MLYLCFSGIIFRSSHFQFGRPRGSVLSWPRCFCDDDLGSVAKHSSSVG
uniref:Uncharacterized protein n=1 Tax=Anguilla anguilla TaxID=7936 RepID=A0A0E9RVL8_ANGAN